MTYRQQLKQRAVHQRGYVTTEDARELGVPPSELRKLAFRGGLTHVSYGVYRFDDVPASRRDVFLEAVLRVGPRAFLTHDAVLAFHDLGLVNPQVIRVGSPVRTQAAHPPWLEVVQRAVDETDLTVYDGVPSTTVRRALLDCRGFVMADRLVAAAEEAADLGLLRRREREETISLLSSEPVEVTG